MENGTAKSNHILAKDAFRNLNKKSAELLFDINLPTDELKTGANKNYGSTDNSVH